MTVSNIRNKDSYLTEDGRVVSNRQAASWARMESAKRRMGLSQGLMDLV